MRASIAIVLLLPQLTGCFRYVPASHAGIPSGSEVTVDITDRGRVALVEPVGPGVRRINGRVLQSTDTLLVLSVATVEFIDLGTPVRWAGEPVQISREFVAEVRERQLSHTRTWLTVGLVAAGAVLATFIGLVGGGGEPGPDRPPDPNEPD